jgi:hypothetical protein
MMATHERASPLAASRGKILAATLAAFAAAAVILVAAVLPAEYGVDPLGTGAKLGLSGLSGAGSEQAVPSLRGVSTSETAPYKVDTIEVQLRPGKSVEYKYRLATGGSFVYSWSASGKVIYDFHGQPDDGTAADAKSYERRDHGEETDRAHGSFTAPFSGVHGWYWENTGDEDVTITLSSAGFYSGSEEFLEKGGSFTFEVGELQHGKPRQTLTP